MNRETKEFVALFARLWVPVKLVEDADLGAAPRRIHVQVLDRVHWKEYRKSFCRASGETLCGKLRDAEKREVEDGKLCCGCLDWMIRLVRSEEYRQFREKERAQ